MNKQQSRKVILRASQRLTLGIICLLTVFVLSTFAQTQPAKLVRRGRAILSGRAIDPPPARRPQPPKGGEVWSTKLPPVRSGASIPASTNGSVSVGGGSLSLRRPPAKTALPQAPQSTKSVANTSAGWNAAAAEQTSYAHNLRKGNFSKLSPSARRERGAAIQNAEKRAAVARTNERKSVSGPKVNEKKRVAITAPYKRPANATTPAQRAAVQGKPCVTCQKTKPKMYADHKRALVKEYYETGKINKRRMRHKNAVQPQCPECSSRDGAKLSRYSREQRKRIKKDHERPN